MIKFLCHDLKICHCKYNKNFGKHKKIKAQEKGNKKTQKKSPISPLLSFICYLLSFVGEGGLEPPNSSEDRFTVCCNCRYATPPGFLSDAKIQRKMITFTKKIIFFNNSIMLYKSIYYGVLPERRGMKHAHSLALRIYICTHIRRCPHHRISAIAICNLIQIMSIITRYRPQVHS